MVELFAFLGHGFGPCSGFAQTVHDALHLHRRKGAGLWVEGKGEQLLPQPRREVYPLLQLAVCRLCGKVWAVELCQLRAPVSTYFHDLRLFERAKIVKSFQSVQTAEDYNQH